MPNRPPLHHGLGRARERIAGASSTTAAGHLVQRGYTTAWQKARAAYLAQHPLCVLPSLSKTEN
jgi:hypothetical protein